jgi:ATP-dependent Clp protease protease subunit
MSLLLPKERNIYLADQVTQDSINNISKSIIEVNESDKILEGVYSAYGLKYEPNPIKIFIDSYGGFVYQCYGLLGLMDSSKVPIHTIVTGCAMSCGFLIAVSGHKRFAYKHSTFMYHQISTMKWGTVKEVEDEMIETRRLQAILEKHVVSKTGITKSELKKNYELKKDWYFSAEEARDYKIVDEVL